MESKRNSRKWIWTGIMFFLGIFFLLPFFWMVSASLKLEAHVFNYPIEWIPKEWKWDNYRTVWVEKLPFYLYYWNSIKVTVIATLLSLLFASMGAYGFSQIRFRGRNVLFLTVMATFLIPPQVVIVPQFILFRQLGLFDTHAGLILISTFTIFGLFMLRQFFMSVNKEYFEAAKMDGAGHLRTYWRIGLPLIRPAVATLAILRFIWTWNDYQNPFIFIRSKELWTVQLGIANFTNVDTGQIYSLIMAGTVSAIVPLLIIFLIAQKHVIEGVSLGGVKG